MHVDLVRVNIHSKLQKVNIYIFLLLCTLYLLYTDIIAFNRHSHRINLLCGCIGLLATYEKNEESTLISLLAATLEGLTP